MGDREAPASVARAASGTQDCTGQRPVSEVNTADVLEILAPTWHVKAGTARVVRQRLRTLLEWRSDNPCEPEYDRTSIVV